MTTTTVLSRPSRMMETRHRHEEDQVEEDREVLKARWVVVVPEVSPTVTEVTTTMMTMVEITHSSGEDLDLLVGRQILFKTTHTKKKTKKKKT